MRHYLFLSFVLLSGVGFANEKLSPDCEYSREFLDLGYISHGYQIYNKAIITVGKLLESEGMNSRQLSLLEDAVNLLEEFVPYLENIFAANEKHKIYEFQRCSLTTAMVTGGHLASILRERADCFESGCSRRQLIEEKLKLVLVDFNSASNVCYRELSSVPDQ